MRTTESRRRVGDPANPADVLHYVNRIQKQFSQYFSSLQIALIKTTRLFITSLNHKRRFKKILHRVAV